MLTKLVRSFSTQSSFNISKSFNKFKGALKAPVKHLKRLAEPSGLNYSPMTNTTQEAFDEVAQEWQALIIGNSFDVNTFNYLEANSQANFGTVDNPHVIFTSEAPFRYVGCTGPTNEDDYEGHEFQVFMLKEGPMQRCPSCGQVFKLVRLRNEFSPEMDYYLSGILPYEMQEMGEMDTTFLMTLKYNLQYEYSQFETPSNMVYSLVNPDDHDRILTDPAYRLERSALWEEKMKVVVESLQHIDKEWIKVNGPLPKFPINKFDYTTLIEVEKAIKKLDRNFRKVDKFYNRRFIDPENHDRREQRMRSRAQQRWDNNYNIFYGGLTEEEQKYRDYFETDIEHYPEVENVEMFLDEQEILTSGNYQLEKFDFQELYTRQPEDDQQSLIQKIIFKFKYRIAKDSSEEYLKRNERMIKNSIIRHEKNKITELLQELNVAIQQQKTSYADSLTKQYSEFVLQESIEQFKDYFGEEAEFDLKILQNIDSLDKSQLMNMYENVSQPLVETKGFESIPMRKWDNSSGLWGNFVQDFAYFQILIKPQAEMIQQSQNMIKLAPLDTTKTLKFQQDEETQKIESKSAIKKKK